AAVRTLVLSAPGPMLEVPGQEPIPLDEEAQRGAAAKALTRTLVPLRAAERAELIAAIAAAAAIDLHARLAGPMLTSDEIRELHAAGWTIGAHTGTHSNVALALPAAAEPD